MKWSFQRNRLRGGLFLVWGSDSRGKFIETRGINFGGVVYIEMGYSLELFRELKEQEATNEVLCWFDTNFNSFLKNMYIVRDVLNIDVILISGNKTKKVHCFCSGFEIIGFMCVYEFYNVYRKMIIASLCFSSNSTKARGQTRVRGPGPQLIAIWLQPFECESQ